MSVWSLLRAQNYLKVQPDPGHQAWLTPGGPVVPGQKQANLRWVIGSYTALRGLAQALRTDATLWAKYSALGGRLGRRNTDNSPFGPRTITSFRKQIEGVAPSPLDAAEQTEINKRWDKNTTRRLTEQWSLAGDYFTNATLEAHHIVEKRSSACWARTSAT